MHLGTTVLNIDRTDVKGDIGQVEQLLWIMKSPSGPQLLTQT